MKRIISYFLTLTLIFPSLAVYGKETLSSSTNNVSSGDSNLMTIVPVPAKDGRPGELAGYIVIAAAPDSEIPKFQKLPNIGFVNSGSRDRANPYFQRTDVIVNFNTLKMIDAVPKAKMGLVARAKAKLKAAFGSVFEWNEDTRNGLLFCFVPVTSYGSVSFYLTSDTVNVLETAGIVFFANAFVAVASKLWNKTAHHVGELIVEIAGKNSSEEAKVRQRKLGHILTAYLLNLAVSISLLSVNDLITSAWAAASALLMALFESNEVIDFKHREVFDNSKITKKQLSQYQMIRVALFGILGGLSFSGSTPAEVVAVGLVVCYIVAYLSPEKLDPIVSKAIGNSAKLVGKISHNNKPAESVVIKAPPQFQGMSMQFTMPSQQPSNHADCQDKLAHLFRGKAS